ncbi:MAG: hypothetical protein ACPGJV_02270 [Bacteriovoracaceae bacterium]
MPLSTVIFQSQSLIILILFYIGIAKRKSRSLHVKLMTIGIIWDVLLVLQIELTRSAINTASKVTSNNWLMNFHVTIAITTVVLYFVQIYFGRKLMKSNGSVRLKHKLIGYTTIVLRTLVFFTSFIIKS